MDIQERCDRLKKIYEIYDKAISGVNRACQKHCAACCTCNVTATTLEGWLVYHQLFASVENSTVLHDRLSAVFLRRRFHPRVTINELASLCLRGQDPPEEVNDPSAGICPLIDGDLCTIYAARPFGCRAMLSTQDCTGKGEALMPPLVLSINNVVMQVIESLDRPGASGNMIDILLFLSDPDNRRDYQGRRIGSWPAPLRSNQPFPALMIPTEHRDPIQPIVRALQEVLTQGSAHGTIHRCGTPNL